MPHPIHGLRHIPHMVLATSYIWATPHPTHGLRLIPYMAYATSHIWPCHSHILYMGWSTPHPIKGLRHILCMGYATSHVWPKKYPIYGLRRTPRIAHIWGSSSATTLGTRCASSLGSPFMASGVGAPREPPSKLGDPPKHGCSALTLRRSGALALLKAARDNHETGEVVARAACHIRQPRHRGGRPSCLPH